MNTNGGFSARMILVGFVLALIWTAPNAGAMEGVSPGAADRMAQVNNACPTFSWEGEAGAVINEIVAYAIHENEDPATAQLTAETQVVYSRVPGGATSWTPSADQCFAPGGRYVWFVRAVSELAGDQVIEASDWSAGRYFTVPAAPTEEEVARAIEVMRWLEATNGDGSPTLFAAPAPAPAPVAVAVPDADSGSAAPKSVPTASAAIRGEHPDTSGEKYGVVGTTASYEGAGLAAANLEGGPDLVLDGSVNGAVDTTISEGVLTRSSASDQTFLFHNGGGGLLNIITHGTVTGDAFIVQYGTVIDDDGNWLGVGDTLPCPGCVTSSDITDGAVANADLANGSVTGAKIGAGAVDTGQIRAGAVENAQLADNAVTASKIQDGAVRNADLGSNAVTTDKIADGTITAADIDATSSIYVSKSQLYEREDSVTFAAIGTVSRQVYCDDANDLPLAGWCDVDSTAALFAKGHKGLQWQDPAGAAGWECHFNNLDGGNYTGTSTIACVSVPGP